MCVCVCTDVLCSISLGFKTQICACLGKSINATKHSPSQLLISFLSRVCHKRNNTAAQQWTFFHSTNIFAWHFDSFSSITDSVCNDDTQHFYTWLGNVCMCVGSNNTTHRIIVSLYYMSDIEIVLLL